ncbi:MAG: hypothetical protein K2K68_02510 [Duncaniella sp.]|nr:hypothetical protein [Duncaniella sp.]
MNLFTISDQSDFGGILSTREIEHESNKISKSLQSEIERQFNQFEKRIVVRIETSIEPTEIKPSDLNSQELDV